MSILRKISLPLAAASLLLGAASVTAQTPTPPRAPVRIAVPAPAAEAFDSELRLAVEPNVNIKFCVAEAELKISGWDRPEVRVFVREGRKIGFDVLERSKATGRANWLWIKSAFQPPAPAMRPHTPECLSGESVEIDLPAGAAISIEGRSTDAVVDTVRKVSMKIIEGNIALRNITGGISAFAYQGDLTVENSAGDIAVESTTGNVIAYDVQPGEIGDVFRVRTNSGAVLMQNVEHRQIEANSITGSVSFDGRFLPGGVYAFKTSAGSIRLALPAATAATFKAIYGFGSFSSEYPLDFATETVMPTGKSVVATMGGGGSNVTITTNSGSIRINKQKK